MSNVEITDSEKDNLRDILKEIVALEDQEKNLKNDKLKLEENLGQFRPEFRTTLENVGINRMKANKTVISRVSKYSHRKPTLEEVYSAIQNILGPGNLFCDEKIILYKKMQ